MVTTVGTPHDQIGRIRWEALTAENSRQAIMKRVMEPRMVSCYISLEVSTRWSKVAQKAFR